MSEKDFICNVAEIFKDDSDDSIYKLILNKGYNDGLTLGLRFIIYEISKEIFDPITNKSLGNLEVVKGTGKIVHLQENMCTIASNKYEKAEHNTTKISSGIGIISSLGRREETTYSPPRQIPFANPKIGDCAKQIP